MESCQSWARWPCKQCRKYKTLEAIKRRWAAIDLHAEHGAMPSLQQRGGRLLGVEVVANLASHLSLPDHLRERRCPLGKNLAEALTDEFTVLRRFQPHVPRQAPIPPSGRGEEFGDRIEVGAKTLDGSTSFIVQRLGDDGPDLIEVVIENRHAEFLF